MRFPFCVAADREFDAAGFGLNAVDHLIVVPHYPAGSRRSNRNGNGELATPGHEDDLRRAIWLR